MSKVFTGWSLAAAGSQACSQQAGHPAAWVSDGPWAQAGRWLLNSCRILLFSNAWSHSSQTRIILKHGAANSEKRVAIFWSRFWTAYKRPKRAVLKSSLENGHSFRLGGAAAPKMGSGRLDVWSLRRVAPIPDFLNLSSCHAMISASIPRMSPVPQKRYMYCHLMCMVFVSMRSQLSHEDALFQGQALKHWSLLPDAKEGKALVGV